LTMKTARGIYYRLWESEYVHTVGNIRFHFSSKLYKEKFIGTYQDFIKQFNQKLNKVYKNQYILEADYLALIRYYDKLEKRGFYIVLNGEVVTCLEDLVFDVTVSCKMKLDA
jgi:hypothetical protein